MLQLRFDASPVVFFYTLSAGVSDACSDVVSKTSSVGVPNTLPTTMSPHEVVGFRSSACFSCEIPENKLGS